MRCLRQILHVKWQDHIPDTEVLQMSNSRSIGSMLMESQLRWSGHIARMPDYHLPKRVFFGELWPRKRYKDTLKVSLKRCETEPESWEHVAQDRATWRNLVKWGVSKYEQEFIDQNADKLRRRNERLAGHLLMVSLSLVPTAAA